MFTVTALQPNTEQTDATITLSWNPCDFSYEGNGDGSASCALAANTPAEACTYTDSVHSAKGESFKFKANHDDPDAVTGVTVTTSSRRQR